MSVIDTIKSTLTNDGRVQGTKVKPADVEARISEAEAVLKALNLRFYPAAFAVEENPNDENTAALAALTTSIAATEARIRSLQVAHTESIRVQALVDKAAAANVWAAQQRACSQHAAAAKSAAVAVINALGVLAESYERMISALDSMRSAVPVGCHLDDNSIPSIPYIEGLLAFEIHKLATLAPGNQTVVAGSLPGWIKPAYGNENLRLVEQIAGHVDETLKVIRETGAERFS